MNIFETIFFYVKEIFTERLVYFPSNIRAALLILLFCVFVVVDLYFYIIIRRIIQAYNNTRIIKWKEVIDNMLANLIIHDFDEVEEAVTHFYPRLKKLPLKNKIVNKILITEILNYHRNFIGKTAQVLEELFLKLELDKSSLKKIKNNNWEVKIEGIREISHMELEHVADELLVYTDDENSILRMEAQAAFIQLSKNDPFRFLERAHERILDWHQLVLFEIITKNKKLAIPSFSKWLTSKNDTVVMLCLKLIDHFMQFDAAATLEKLLQHRNVKIRKKAIQILGKLEIDGSEKNMFEIYFDQPLEIKLEILNTLGRISSGKYTDFFVSRIYSEDYKIKTEALRAIRMDVENGNNTLKNIYNSTSPANQLIIKHVLDERIKV